MIIPLEIVNNFVYENFNRVSVSKGGTHFLCRCPLCGDSKKSLSKRRLNIDYNNGNPGYHCFNCERSGSFIQLYAEIKGLDIDIARKQLIKFDTDYLSKVLSTRKPETKKENNSATYHDYILDDCMSIDNPPNGIIEKIYYKKLVDFKRERKVPIDYPVYVAYKGRYKGRIVIPVLQDNHIVYFQGRAIGDLEPKYLNPALPKNLIILNKDNFDRSKFIILTEGILDAVQVGRQGTCILGSYIQDELIESLLSLTDMSVIVALDNPFCDQKGMDEIMRYMVEGKHANEIKYLVWPHKYIGIKDLNQLSTSEVINIYDFVVGNAFWLFDAKVRFNIGRRNK